MIEFFLATALTCSEAQDLIDTISQSRTEYKEELIDTIKLNTNPACYEGSERNS